MKAQQITIDTRQEKYFKDGETTTDELFYRIARAISSVEDIATGDTCSKAIHYQDLFLDLLRNGFFIPSGRIASAAGSTLKKATLISCFVQPVGDAVTGTDDEGRPSIYTALAEAAETMRRGGGVGYNFSAIRPEGALVKGTKSRASGPLSYMRVFSQSCDTVESAGARRGAQMGVLDDNHPDIFAFIKAKTDGEFANFNLSVAISDAFMDCVEAKGQWNLTHMAEPAQSLIDAGAHKEGDVWVYKTVSATELYDEIMKHAYYHAEPGVVFKDNINKDNNLQYCETITATNPCGEQPLPNYGSCQLGPMNLTKFVANPFTGHAAFDFVTFAESVGTAVRFLDNVLDVTAYPLDKQYDESMSKRRIGLGITGLGSMLVVMGLSYDTEQARQLVEQIMASLRNNAYRTSAELAKEKGAFPLFDTDKYMASPFVKRLPKEIRRLIKKNGMRNSHLLSIAPTGTISLAFGEVCSNGLEPVFNWSYERRKVMEDGSTDIYPTYDYSIRLAKELDMDISNIEKTHKTAQQISADDHLAMMEVIQPYVDSALSKTVNLPEDYDYELFKGLYKRAHANGLKGVAVYRDGSIAGAVLSNITDDKDQQPEEGESADPDRRLQLKELPASSLESLRWQDRPQCPSGNMGWNYLVKHPDGSKYALFVGQYDNGSSWPFECWINGIEAPRYLGSLAKTISADMRSNDRAWLKMKLDSLEKVASDDGFQMPFPPLGETKRVPSIVSGMAQLIRYRCDELNAFELEDTPMMNALMSIKEPKSGSTGTLSWSWDIHNPHTGEDFVLTLKELTLPNGEIRPFSMWLSNQYPRVLDGLCKLLSIDMRITDPAWIGMKLRKLIDYSEPESEFLAPQPGTGKMKNQPSTVAYIARLVLHRFTVLTILDEHGYPVNTTESTVVNINKHRKLQGKACPECNNLSLVKRDGCDCCTECHYIGTCG